MSRKNIFLAGLSAAFMLSGPSLASELRQTRFVFESPAAMWKEELTHVICDSCSDMKSLTLVPPDYTERILKARVPGPEAKQEEKQAVSEPAPAVFEPVKETVFFDFDSYTVKPSELEKMKKILIPGGFYEITGYTCSIGTKEYNDRLAMRRAEAVYNGLVSLGVDAQRITRGGKGKCCYADPDKRSEKNRRVEIILSKEGR